MIVVDTTVWVDHLNDRATSQVQRLREIISGHQSLIIVGDLVLCEVLQGLSSDREAALVEQAFRSFIVEPMVSPELAVQSATNYRALRARGITIRKTIDMLIGTFCIDRDHALLHNGRDYDAMALHLGLSVVE